MVLNVCWPRVVKQTARRERPTLIVIHGHQDLGYNRNVGGVRLGTGASFILCYWSSVGDMSVMYSTIDDLWQVRFAASRRGGGGLLRVYRTVPAQSAGPAIVGPLLHEALSERTRWRPAYPVRQKVSRKHTHLNTKALFKFEIGFGRILLMQMCCCLLVIATLLNDKIHFISKGMSNTLPDFYRVPSRSTPVHSSSITSPLLAFRPFNPTADAAPFSKYSLFLKLQ